MQTAGTKKASARTARPPIRNWVASFGPVFVSNHLPHFLVQAENLSVARPTGVNARMGDAGRDKRAKRG
jgi:hypothetical protein